MDEVEEILNKLDELEGLIESQGELILFLLRRIEANTLVLPKDAIQAVITDNVIPINNKKG